MANENEQGSLVSHIENRIATIEFGHPAGNSFPAELLQRLTETIDTLGQSPDITLIVLKSHGDGPFCAGASFDELIAVTNLQEGNRFFSGFANLLNAMRKCPKLIVGRIQGKTVGGGVGIVAACDYAFATRKAAVKLSELSIGIGPFVIEPAVSRKIGTTAMAQLTLEAHEWQTAEWAKEKGLYANVFDTVAEMDVALINLTTKLASYNPSALAEIKKVFWQGTGDWQTLLYERAAISGQLVLSEFTTKALSEFKKY